MGNSHIKERYANAKKSGVFHLSNERVSQFPVVLFELKSILRSIDLNGNRLSTLPQEIGLFENLKYLNLTENKISSLPDGISKLRKLETLYLACNRLKSLPPSFSELTNLRQLCFGGNHFTEFPTGLRGLKLLDILDLSRNKITSVSDEIGHIHAVEIILSGNRITYLSDEVINCPRLKTLRLEDNRLKLSAISPNLLKYSKISVLELENNLFEMKNLPQIEGYDDYMERYTAVKKKMY